MKRKAQVAMEYLMVVGFSLMLLIPLLALFSGTFSNETTFLLTQASQTATDLISVSEQTFYQGVGSKQVISLRIPEGFSHVGVYRSLPVDADLEVTTITFNTTNDLTTAHRSNVPIFVAEDLDLSKPGVYELVVETQQPSTGNSLYIFDDFIYISRKNG